MTATAFSHTDFADHDDTLIRAAFDNARPPEWPAPDMSLLNASRRAAVPMPVALLGPATDTIRLIAEGTSTAIDYPACAYLAACASLIGGKRKVRPYVTSNWSEPAILWFGAVGDPSSRKSPALEAVIDGPLRAIERDGADLHKEALRDWKEAETKAKAVKADWEKALASAIKDGAATMPAMPREADEPDEPQRRRTYVTDVTPEAMAAILAGNPQGTLHYRDELAGWLLGFERYAPGGREFWLEAYGGRSFVIDRKGAKGPLTVPFNGVSVAGGIQPGKLAECLLSGADDGLVARFLWAWPDKLPFSRPRKIADTGALEAVYRRLEGLTWGQDDDGRNVAVTLPLSAAAADLFEAWQTDNAETDEQASGLMKSFLGKLDGALLRLALTAELSAWAWRGGLEPREVSLDTLAAAAEWVDDYAKPMAARVYGDASLPLADRNASTLARYIVKSKLRTVNKRELKRSPHKSALPGLRDAKHMDAAFDVLIDADWLMPAGTREGDTPGKASATYRVNPAVHEVRQ